MQISDENLHHVRELLDEVFGVRNYVGQIAFRKTGSQQNTQIPSAFDYAIVYGRDASKTKFRQLFTEKKPGDEGARQYFWIESPDAKSYRQMADGELADPSSIPNGWRIFRPGPLSSPGYNEQSSKPLKIGNKEFSPGANRHWSIATRSSLNARR